MARKYYNKFVKSVKVKTNADSSHKCADTTVDVKFTKLPIRLKIKTGKASNSIVNITGGNYFPLLRTSADLMKTALNRSLKSMKNKMGYTYHLYFTEGYEMIQDCSTSYITPTNILDYIAKTVDHYFQDNAVAKDFVSRFYSMGLIKVTITLVKSYPKFYQDIRIELIDAIEPYTRCKLTITAEKVLPINLLAELIVHSHGYFNLAEVLTEDL